MKTPTEIKAEIMAAVAAEDWSAVERIVDTGIRHKPDRTHQDFINHWTTIGNAFAYATHDHSFGEFEKEFAIIMVRMLKAELAAQKAGL